jgi:hypothetical protein
MTLAFSKPPRLLKKIASSAENKSSTAGPKTRDISDQDQFEVDDEFRSPRRRVKIAVIDSLEQLKKETSETHSKIFENRQHETDAAIVRIMKSRKVLPHTQLIAELFKHLRFQATNAEIKKRIESLIDREYVFFSFVYFINIFS